MNEKIQKAIKIAGTQKQLVDAINKHLPAGSNPVSQARVSGWLNGKENIPSRLLLPISKAVDFQVSVTDLLSEMDRLAEIKMNNKE